MNNKLQRTKYYTAMALVFIISLAITLTLSLKYSSWSTWLIFSIGNVGLIGTFILSSIQFETMNKDKSR
jgi:hypothetical protein